MREKVENVEEQKYGFTAHKENLKSRLDLNDLLNRLKDKKKRENKINTSIIFGALIIAAVIIIILNL